LSPDLATALRTETPAAPSGLRDRVALIAATPPPPRRTISPRRALLWGAPATAVGSLAVALVVALISPSAPPTQSTGGQVLQDVQREQSTQTMELSKLPPARLRAAAPGPSTNRAQDVQADLRVLVDDANDLSATTQRALRITRRLGGYVLAVRYGTPEPTEGTADLRVRIPVSRVQAAIVQFSDLGRILAQQTQITDLQQQLDELTRQIRRARGDKTKIAALRRQRIQLERRAAYATVGLNLTTHEPEKKTIPPGRLDRAVDDATGVLVAELAIGAYALIVASPFLLLLVAAFAGSRAYRRYADQRLLERA
jgi:Domain of unknown function (DUF4349)